MTDNHHNDHHNAHESWELEGSYSPDNYYTYSVDGKGHKEKYNLPVPPSVYGRIGELIASKKVAQYRTPQDFIRDAIIHRLAYLNDFLKDAGIAEAIKHEMLLSQIEDQARTQRQLESLVTRTQEELELAYGRQDRVMMKSIFERVEYFINDVREPYHSDIENTVKKYRRLLRDMPIARIH